MSRTFSFEALDRFDALQRGTVVADHQDAALGSLAARGLIVVKLREREREGDGGRINKLSDLLDRGPNRSGRQMERLLDEWARLLSIGLNIDQALAISCASHGSSALGSLATDIRKRLKEGNSLGRALSIVMPGSTVSTIACIDAGEKSGHLAEMLANLSQRMATKRTFTSDLRASLTYPAFVLMTALGLMGILVEIVLPSIGDVLSSSGAPLPWTTQAMLDGAAFLRGNGALLSLCFLALVGTVVAIFRSDNVRLSMERAMLRVPILGPILLAVDLSFYLNSLAVQVHGGVPLPRAVALAQSALKMRLLSIQASTVERKLAQGMRLSEAAATSLSGAKELPMMIRVGEETGRLNEVLSHAAAYYEQEARRALKRATSLITPSVTIGTGFLVGAVVLSIMSAMVGLNDTAMR